MTLTNERTKSKSQPWQEFAIEKTWNVFLFTNDLVIKNSFYSIHLDSLISRVPSTYSV